MQTLTHTQLDEKFASNDNFLLINVLPEEFFLQGHIPGSINIPYNAPDFTARIEEITGNKQQQIVVYCAKRDCTASDQAAEILEGKGFTHVYDFAGGMKEWKDNNHKVETGPQKSIKMYDTGNC